MTLRPSLATKESREFWDFVERTARDVRAREPFWFTPEQRAVYWRLVDEGKRDSIEDFREGA